MEGDECRPGRDRGCNGEGKVVVPQREVGAGPMRTHPIAHIFAPRFHEQRRRLGYRVGMYGRFPTMRAAISLIVSSSTRLFSPIHTLLRFWSMSTRFTGLVGVLLLLSGIGAPCVEAQTPDSTLQDRVERAVHGPDGAGRDGPMARLDRDLVRLYYEYRAYRETEAEAPFAPSDKGLPVREARVTVDAIATSRPAALLDSLRALGLHNGAQAQRLVSGRLPIAALRDAAGLSLLQSMRAAQARTRTNTGGMLPAPPPDANVAETAPDTASSKQGASQTETPETENTPTADPDQPSASDAPEDGEAESASRSSGAEPVENPTAAPTAEADATTDQSPQIDSASSPAAADENTDPSDTMSASATESTSVPTWAYVVGGLVLLGLGGLFGLRRRE